MNSTLTQDALEEQFEQEIPCGGVYWLHIPPCGQPAKLVLDRMSGHPCSADSVTDADFKCVACHAKWLHAIVMQMVKNGFMICGGCKKRFTSVVEFANYIPL